jgi:hypothetical protein
MVHIIKANIVNLWNTGNIVCVTTNGFIKKNGEAVMGRGNALAMAKAIPKLPLCLANHIRTNGNVVGPIYKKVISFPVKPIQGDYSEVLPHMRKNYKPTDTIPGFFCKARVDIIEKSVNELNELITQYDEHIKNIYLPIPGVNNGQLTFDNIKHILNNLNNKVVLVNL